MSSEHSPATTSAAITQNLPLWGLFLAVAIVAWQLVEMNANMKTHTEVLRELRHSTSSIAGSVGSLEGGARLGWPGYWKSVEGIREELKLIREGKRGSEPPKGNP
jgi:hypothetical protein